MDEVRVELRRVSDSSVVVFDDRFPINDVLTDSGTVEIEITLVILQDPESFYLHLEVIGTGQVWYEVCLSVQRFRRMMHSIVPCTLFASV